MSDPVSNQARLFRGLRGEPARFAAPMAGITHSAFRRLLAEYGGYDALWTEMISAPMLLREDVLRSPWTRRRPSEGRVIYQLLASRTEGLAEAIRRLAPLAPDGLDLNAACAAWNVRRQGGGGSLSHDDERLRAIVAVMRREFAGPLLVKLRLGLDEAGWRERLVARVNMLAGEGVDAVTIHPRFATDKFKRRVRYEELQPLVSATGLPLILSGDILDPASLARPEIARSGISGVMIGRALAARPWLLGHWERAEQSVDYADVWTRLYEYVREDFDARQALVRMKVFTAYFARNFTFGHLLFTAVQNAIDLADARARALSFLNAGPGLNQTLYLDGV